MIDIAREIFSPHNITIDYRIVPWSRAVEGTTKGEYTGAVGASRNDAPALVFPEEELARNALSFWVKKGNPWRFTGPDSITSISLGLITGYDYREWLSAYATANRQNANRVQFVFGENPMELNLHKLLAGRIDALVDSEAAVRFAASRLRVLDSIELAGKDDVISPCYIAFSPANPRSPDYARILSAGIIQLRTNGRLAKILAGYGLTDWKE